jgi:hypothetical protein
LRWAAAPSPDLVRRLGAEHRQKITRGEAELR